MATEKDKVSASKEVITALDQAKEAIEQYQRTMQSVQMEPIDNLGVVVINERKKQKITLDVLAKLSGVSVGTILAIEAGKNSVSLSNVQKILNALGKRVWIR